MNLIPNDVFESCFLLLILKTVFDVNCLDHFKEILEINFIFSMVDILLLDFCNLVTHDEHFLLKYPHLVL